VRPASPHTAKPKSWLVRLAGAQEFGLVVVILLLGTFLTFATPMVERTVRTLLPLSPSAGLTLTVADVPGGFTITTPASASSGASSKTYLEADGYEYQMLDDAIVLKQQVRVNKFLNLDNLISVLTSTAFIAIMAVGMTGIIVSGGIDLSVGSIYALAAVIGAMALKAVVGTSSTPGAGGLFSGILTVVAVCGGVGALCGFINGFASVGLKVHPFIITLGGMAIYRGVAFVSTQGLSVGPFPDSFILSTGKLQIFGTSAVPLICMIIVAVVGWFVLSRTVFGRRVYAIGGNEIAAKYAGVPVGRTKVKLFTLCGMLAGVSAALYLCYFGAGSSDAGQGYELNVIAAAVVGGASLSGGRGSAIGAVLGAIVIQLIDNSILMLQIDQNYKNIVIGLAIVLAVVVDQTKHRLLGGAARH